jgi:CRP-like cAMP-binding protein
MHDTWSPGQNHLLAALPGSELALLEPSFEPVSLERGDVLARPRESIGHAYFPLHGMVSVVAVMADGRGAEVATVGNEGMVGLPIVFGADSSPFHLMSQLDGNALRISATDLQRVLETRGALTSMLATYSQAYFVQTAQNAACNGLHPVSRRAARWLLAMRDRADRDSFYLTQEFLAFMLGAARQTVGRAVAELAAQRLIRYRHGRVTVLDPEGLATASCECYGIVRTEFVRLLGIART